MQMHQQIKPLEVQKLNSFNVLSNSASKSIVIKKNVVLYNPFILTLSTMSYNCISFTVMQNVVFSHTCFILVYLNLTAISNQQTPTD